MFECLETVVLTRDFSEHGFRAGDLGTIVELCEPDGLEVEFVTGGGRTKAVLTLRTADVRPLLDSDVMSVRTLDRSA